MRCVGIFLLVGVYLFTPVKATGENHPAGARSSGVAHASVALIDIWCFHNNQAALAYLESLSLGFFHQPGYVREMDHQVIALLIPVSGGALSGSFAHYGYRHYHESKAGIAYGRYLAKNFCAGIQIDYFHTGISGIYGSSHQLTFEAGMHLRVNEQWSLATHFFNPLDPFSEGQLPAVFRLGVGWKPSEKLLLLAEMEKDPDRQAIPKMAVEYTLGGMFCLRSGISFNPVLHCFGVGYAWSGFQADLACSFHPVLGHTPNLALSYAF